MKRLLNWWRTKSILDRLFFWGNIAFGALMVSALLQLVALVGSLVAFLAKGD